MTELPDLEPTARRVTRLLDNITDDQLSAPTPCADYAVRDLLSHLIGLTIAFRDAASKTLGPTTATSPDGPPPELPADWRTQLPRHLEEVAAAWRSPAAWEGMTQAGGVTLPGEAAGRVALNEIMLHGWDLARATRQEYEGDEPSVRELIAFLTPAASAESAGEAEEPDAPADLFGPPVDVPADAPPLDRLLGLAGRNPHWQAPR
ncbi:TIGR03086 family protein [Streptomyces sp. N2-109]|uniref:TIGR03086 family protein n=1 Tax=Streptomyces gossypii TaxID=2883101 RepID=A0ABT2JYW5_9ACTN|nr:TIGR03086 family metal-binding protein [Streptomyces gossypii]MCT2592886.1 TIGR03086 family protein [Streptomyces gossypii]